MPWHYMHVEMKHYLSAGRLVELLQSDAVSLEGNRGGASDSVGATRHMGEVVRRNVQNVACRSFWNHQGMPRRAGHDVQKGEHMIVFINLVTREFPTQDLCENVVVIVTR